MSDPTELDFHPALVNFTMGAIERGEAHAWRRARWLIVAGIAIGWSIGASAETIDGASIRVIDGDTVALPCDPVRGIYPGCAEKIRLEAIDAPEVAGHQRCEAELAPAYRAKARLAEMLAGHAAEITRTGRDRYGRTLGRIETEQGDVAERLLAEGLALPWAPGRAAWAERCRHWCPGVPRCEE